MAHISTNLTDLTVRDSGAAFFDELRASDFDDDSEVFATAFPEGSAPLQVAELLFFFFFFGSSSLGRTTSAADESTVVKNHLSQSNTGGGLDFLANSDLIHAHTACSCKIWHSLIDYESRTRINKLPPT